MSTGAHAAHRQLLHEWAVAFFHCLFHEGEWLVTLRATHAPPAVSISTAQQRVYLFVFVEGDRR